MFIRSGSVSFYAFEMLTLLYVHLRSFHSLVLCSDLPELRHPSSEAGCWTPSRLCEWRKPLWAAGISRNGKKKGTHWLTYQSFIPPAPEKGFGTAQKELLTSASCRWFSLEISSWTTAWISGRGGWKVLPLFKKIFIYLVAPGLSCGTWGLRCFVQDLRCCVRDLNCGMWALSCSLWDLVPWPGIEPGPPALGAWSLNHWTTREVLEIFILNDVIITLHPSTP